MALFFSGGFACLRKFGLIGGYRSDGGRRSARGEAAEGEKLETKISLFKRFIVESKI